MILYGYGSYVFPFYFYFLLHFYLEFEIVCPENFPCGCSTLIRKIHVGIFWKLSMQVWTFPQLFRLQLSTPEFCKIFNSPIMREKSLVPSTLTHLPRRTCWRLQQMKTKVLQNIWLSKKIMWICFSPESHCIYPNVILLTCAITAWNQEYHIPTMSFDKLWVCPHCRWGASTEQQSPDIPSGWFWAVYEPVRCAGSQPRGPGWGGREAVVAHKTKFAGSSSLWTAKSSFGADDKTEHKDTHPWFCLHVICITYQNQLCS